MVAAMRRASASTKGRPASTRGFASSVVGVHLCFSVACPKATRMPALYNAGRPAHVAVGANTPKLSVQSLYLHESAHLFAVHFCGTWKARLSTPIIWRSARMLTVKILAARFRFGTCDFKNLYVARRTDLSLGGVGEAGEVAVEVSLGRSRVEVRDTLVFDDRLAQLARHGHGLERGARPPATRALSAPRRAPSSRATRRAPGSRRADYSAGATALGIERGHVVWSDLVIGAYAAALGLVGCFVPSGSRQSVSTKMRMLPPAVRRYSTLFAAIQL